MKYLYGASVKGIQEFIFQTNILKEIVGGSELIEEICTGLFARYLHQDETSLKQDPNCIRSAAGQVRYYFDGRGPDTLQTLSNLIKEFPMKVAYHAPGASLVQAVVEIKGELDQSHFRLLEEKLEKQRSQVDVWPDQLFMCIEKCRRTGRAAINYSHDEAIDTAIHAKLSMYDARKGKESLLSKVSDQETGYKISDQIEDITKSGFSSWIAVIHADGNNLGNTIRLMSEQLESKHNPPFLAIHKTFSRTIEEVNRASVAHALQQVLPYFDLERRDNQKSKPFLPFRPVILGGDDLSCIIRADLAIPFINAYLSEFSNKSKDLISSTELLKDINILKSGLTASAGIAFVKHKYPFHYAIHLAESLCKYAKDVSKKHAQPGNPPPASLMFHKMHSTFHRDFKDIIGREGFIHTQDAVISLFNGPYALDKANTGMPHLGTVLKQSQIMGEKGAPQSALREWFTFLSENIEIANQRMDRIKEVNARYYTNALGLDKALDETEPIDTRKAFKTHLYDVMTLASLNSD